MSTCEKCWSDAGFIATSANRCKSEVYAEILAERECTPEEQAGPQAKECPGCHRVVLHQYTGECMAGCGYPPPEDKS